MSEYVCSHALASWFGLVNLVHSNPEKFEGKKFVRRKEGVGVRIFTVSK